jgi:hypothetical protein
MMRMGCAFAGQTGSAGAERTCYRPPMSAEATVTATERAYLRDELDCYFNTYPSVAEGLMVKTWKTGPARWSAQARSGRPEPARSRPGARDTESRPYRLMFTETGLAALRGMMSNGPSPTWKHSPISAGSLGSTRRPGATRPSERSRARSCARCCPAEGLERPPDVWANQRPAGGALGRPVIARPGSLGAGIGMQVTTEVFARIA